MFFYYIISTSIVEQYDDSPEKYETITSFITGITIN